MSGRSDQGAAMRCLPERATTALCAALLALAVAGPATAAPGDLDSTFATGGVFTAPFMTTFPGAEDSHSVAVDSQGRVYLSATQEPQLNGGANRKVNVVRLSSAGVPDPSFGTGGTATLPTTGDVRNAGIVIDAQDRPIVLVNRYETAAAWQIGLTRLTTGGLPDPGFGGGDGVIEMGLPDTPYNTWPAGIALDSGGGILVVGTLIACSGGCTRASGFVARFSGSDGTLDTTYGTGGWTAVGNSGTEMSAIHALPGGGAFVAGYDDYAEWVVTKLTSGGLPDGSFDTDGEARTSLGKGALDLVSDYGLTADSQARPIVVGQFTSGGNGSLAVARWTSTGAPDPTFGTGAPAVGTKLLPSVGGRGEDAAVQCADGKLLVAAIGARPDNALANGMLLARLSDSGELDTTFAPTSPKQGVGFLAAGQTNGGFDLALTTTGAYVSGFRRDQDAMMVYTDYPQVARFAANEGCGGGGGGGTPVTPPVTPPAASAPAAPVAAPPKAAALPTFSKLVTLPSAKACVSRRKFSIRLKVPASSNVVEATVNVNGKRVAVRRGKRLRSTVDLRSLPKGKFRVEVVLKLKDGRKVKDHRRYKTCAPKRRR
jgi:uncharacterized delta-60 repeat protein